MHLERILKLLTILQIITLSQNSHVQQAKQRIRADVGGITGTWLGPGPGPGTGSWRPPPPPKKHHHQQHQNHHHQHQHQQPQRNHHWPAGQRVHHQNRWSGRRKSLDQQQHFTAWTTWTGCGSDCVKRRERFCRVKRKCGHTKQLEEQQCWGCHPAPVSPAAAAPHLSFSHSQPQQIVINAPQSGPQQQQQQPPVVHQMRLPVLQELVRGSSQQQAASDSQRGLPHENDDFYIINKKPKYKKKRKPIYIDVDDYDDLEAEEVWDELEKLQESTSSLSLLKKFGGPVHSLRTHRTPSQASIDAKVVQRNLGTADDDGIEGDVFQYEDFDFDPEVGRSEADQYADSYESDGDYGGAYFRNGSLAKERATPNALIPKHRRIYSKWSRWTKCSPKCTTRRYKKCRIREQCGREVLREIAYCYTEGSFCQQWLQAQVQRTPPYDLRPVAASRRREISAGDYPQSNAIVSDFIMNGKGYRGPEYTPMKLKCGTAAIRSHKRNMYNMLKIIGGKAARKGEWPWQVAIFNRFKEAFCGGTLIAPQWVLTAAHCVRKVLYVRLGEHNLDHEDGTELQLRVLRSFKHPNFDKKTVDSDVALLRLPKPANTTTWIGFSCLPRPYQPLPKNMDCTVIGWGKRRNRDVAGTSILHQAEVPIIPMDNCRSVYHDYTITKNMFCAGHKRGRIDTCAGDSGGPLLCRDTTKPNHPWTIFGITSFGDGCAKRNKFGIYAKVPNYVDWVWSVINCNGNCKLHQRGYGSD